MARNEIKVTITGDTKGLAAATAAADAELAGFGGKLEGFSSRMSAIGSNLRSTGQSLSLGLTLPIVGALGLGTKFAGELEDAQAMSQQVFGAWSGDMGRWAENAAENFGLSTGDAQEWANQMGIRLRQIGGLSEETAATTSQNLVGLAGDFASAFGGSVDEAAQAIGSALTGEFEPLKRYGIVINDAALKNKLFQMTGEEVKGTLSAQQKQTATLALIQEQSALVQGDYARNADGATNSQRTMTASLKDAATTLGTVLLPYVTTAVQFVTGLVDRFKEMSPTMQKVVVIVGLVAAALGPVIYVAGILATAIGAIASPVGLVVAGIAALVAGLVLLYKNNDGFRKWVDDVVDKIRNGLAVAFWFVRDVVIPEFVAAFHWLRENVWPVIQDVAALVGAWVGFLYDRISEFVRLVWPVWSFLFDAIVAVVRFAWPIVQAIVETALRVISGVVRFVTALINGDWSRVWQMIVATARGAWDWIVGVVRGGIDWVLGILRGAAGGIGGSLSAAWTWMLGAAQGGLNAVVGFVSGVPGRILGFFSNAGGWLVDAGRSIMGGLLDGIRAAWDRVAGFLGGLADKIRSLKGPIEKDRVLLVGEGRAIMEGLEGGLRVGWSDVENFLAELAPSLAGQVGPSGQATAAGPAVVPAPLGGTGDQHVHFHGPVARDSERWVLDLLARSNRTGLSSIPGVRP